LENSTNDYCDFIASTFSDWDEYNRLCLSSFTGYENRLNWKSSAAQIKKILEACI
jgi:hypothetical protein